MIIALFGLFSTSCSVKEERSSCPCKLVLDFSGIDTTVVKYLALRATYDGDAVLDEVVAASDFGELYVRDVPRCSLLVNLWAGGADRLDEYGVVIPFGCECPPIYMHSFWADARDEHCFEKIDLHKNHCRLTVNVEGVEQIPYSLTFYGNVDGYNLEGKPSAGDFACVAYPDEHGGVQSLLPRQIDDSLLLEVDDGTAETKIFAIGQHIISSGYDWRTADLEDVTVILDYYVTYVQVVIQRWDKEYFYNISL